MYSILPLHRSEAAHDETMASAAFDGLRGHWTSLELGRSSSFARRNSARRQRSVYRSACRNIPTLDSRRFHHDEAHGWHAKANVLGVWRMEFVERDFLRMPGVDEVYDVRLLHLRLRQFCLLHLHCADG